MKSVKQWSKMVFILFMVCGSALYSVVSNAATVTSQNGGAWETDANWNGGLAPTSADDVVIEDGHNLTLVSNTTIGSLTVNAEDVTILTISSGYTLTVLGDVIIYGGPDATVSQISCSGNLIINGSLIFAGDNSNSQAQLSMGDGSSATLGGSMVFSDFGRVWSSSTANIHTITFNGSGNRDIRFTGMRYRNLVFNTGGDINMQQNLTATTVYGNIDVVSGTFKNNGYAVTGNSARTFTVRSGASLQLATTTGLPGTFNMVLENGSTVRYAGANQTIGVPNNGQNYSNLVISGTGTKSLGGNITVAGNLNINASTLDVTASNYGITIGGNYNNSATFTARSGSVTFNGANAQSISAGGSSFYNVTFNNSSVSGIALNEEMTVTNAATFTDGVVSTGVNRLVIENTSASAISGHSSASFVNGRLRRYIGTNTSTYAFPVGNSVAANGYRLAELINNNLSGTSYIDARFGALTNHDDADLSTSDSYMTYLSVAPGGVWHITPNGQPSSGSYDVRLYLTNMGSFTDNQFGVLKRNDGSTSASDWSAPGNMHADNGDGRLASSGYALRMGLSSFSEFAIGRASTNGNPLPIELVAFAAQPTANGQVELKWTTAIEINNEFFTIERSSDGVNFTEVTRIEGAGNSVKVNHYSTIDAAPANGINYYRLKQTDFDGAFEYSNIVSVTIGKTAEPAAEVTVYPNPAATGQQIQVSIRASETGHTIEVFEIGSGKLVYQTVSSGQTSQLDVPQGLAAGAYLVRVSNDAETQTHKLLVR